MPQSGGAPDYDEAARQVQAACGSSLLHEKWMMIVAYQNSCSHTVNDESLHEGGTTLAMPDSGKGVDVVSSTYLDSSVLTNMMFDRDFPLGVEEAIVKNPLPFALAHSGLREIKHKRSLLVCRFQGRFVSGAGGKPRYVNS